MSVEGKDFLHSEAVQSLGRSAIVSKGIPIDYNPIPPSYEELGTYPDKNEYKNAEKYPGEVEVIPEPLPVNLVVTKRRDGRRMIFDTDIYGDGFQAESHPQRSLKRSGLIWGVKFCLATMLDICSPRTTKN